MAQLILLMAVIILLMKLGGGYASFGEAFKAAFVSQRALLLGIVVVALAASYPAFGFVKRRVNVDLKTKKDEAVEALEKSGYDLESQSGNAMTFRAESLFKRFTLCLFEDRLTLTDNGDGTSTLSGIRKEASKAEWYLNRIEE